MPHPNFKGDAATDGAKRMRARKLYRLGMCQRCKKTRATDRHHKDGDTGNNTPSNIAKLCRRCHMIEDGRLDGLAAARAKRNLPKKAKPCAICGTPSKPLRKGRCHRCNEYFRRNAVEWKPNGDHRFSKRAPDRYCSNCKQLVPKGWSKGRCPLCRLYLTYHGTERPISA